MSMPASQFFKKHINTEQNHSMRSIKSYSNYNISEFLPPTRHTNQSMVLGTVNRSKDKLQTEPCERVINSQYNQLLRRNQILEEQKTKLKYDLQKSHQENNEEKVKLKKCQEENSQLQQQIMKLKTILTHKRIPKIYLDRNVGHFHHFPSYKQSYQVSVQTDPETEQITYSQQRKQQSTSASSSNTQMQQIYQKLDSLKMYKRKPSAQRPTHTGTRTQRPQIGKYNWITSNNKENMMRNSNILDRRSGISCKYDMVRSQTFDLHCVPLEVGERMLEAYMDEPFM